MGIEDSLRKRCSEAHFSNTVLYIVLGNLNLLYCNLSTANTWVIFEVAL